MNKNITDHINLSLKKIEVLFNKAAAVIEALPPGGKVAATKLAEDLGKEVGMTGPALYPIMKVLLNEDYPGVKIKRGATGGIIKDPLPVAVVIAAPVVVPPVVVVAAPVVAPVAASEPVVTVSDLVIEVTNNAAPDAVNV